MQAAKSLRKPTNWQDFESLCKKLWGEIWECPTIKKNGRLGQSQHGVDVYGIPKNEKTYFGIQCKGKDEYTHLQFSEKEIVEEIEKAKHFEPPLGMLYLATTANKDAKIEEYVRKKNIEYKIQSLFGIELFSWEDIVDLIDENRQTHNWYLNNQNFKTQKAVQICFTKGLNEINTSVKFKKVYIDPHSRIPTGWNGTSIFDPYPADYSKHLQFQKIDTRINHSFLDFEIEICNIGSEQLENCVIQLQIEQGITKVSDTNQIGPMSFISHPDSNITILKDNSIEIRPGFALVPKARFVSDKIFVKPKPHTLSLTVKWQLLEKDISKDGTLKINIREEITPEFRNLLDDRSLRDKAKHGDIIDYIE